MGTARFRRTAGCRNEDETRSAGRGEGFLQHPCFTGKIVRLQAAWSMAPAFWEKRRESAFPDGKRRAAPGAEPGAELCILPEQQTFFKISGLGNVKKIFIAVRKRAGRGGGKRQYSADGAVWRRKPAEIIGKMKCLGVREFAPKRTSGKGRKGRKATHFLPEMRKAAELPVRRKASSDHV